MQANDIDLTAVGMFEETQSPTRAVRTLGLPRWSIVVQAVLLLLAGLGTNVSHAQPQAAGWHKDLNAARQVARETGKPIFAVFRCER